MSTDTPLTAEEEAALRRDMNLDSPWARPIPGGWSDVVARLLATLDAARQPSIDVEALRAAFLERMRAPTRGERGDRLSHYQLSEGAAWDIAEQLIAALSESQP